MKNAHSYPLVKTFSKLVLPQAPSPLYPEQSASQVQPAACRAPRDILHIQQHQLALHRLASSAETHVDVRVVGAQLFDQRWYYNVQKTSKPGRERRKCCRGDEGTVVSASTVGGYGASRKGSYRNDCFTLPIRARIRGKCRCCSGRVEMSGRQTD